MEIFTVGGAVRDELLGLTPKDVDYVVVGASPEEMIALGFSQVGADFPVFLHPKTGDEYALARTERKTGDGYHGFEVSADSSVTLTEDLFRRDLTINAMAKSSPGALINPSQVFDPFNGKADLENKVLRHVSEAFADDPLRTVRLARFYARYSDFTIAPETMEMSQAVVRRGDLNHLPHERFWAEMEKVLTEKQPGRFFWAAAHMKMDEHVTFFRELYGHLNNTSKINRINEINHEIAFWVQDSAEKLMFHAAIAAETNSKTIFTAPIRTQNLFHNVNRWRALRGTNVTVDSLFDLLHRAKTWSQSPDAEDLVMAARILRDSGEFALFSVKDLAQMIAETRAVSSASYSDRFQGKALGEAIKEGRKAAIQSVVGKLDKDED